MTQLLSQEEFEYQLMCGSTNDAFVYGMGHVQWQPTYMPMTTPDPMGNPFAYNPWTGGIYLSPKQEMDLSYSDEYYQAISKEILEAITDGKTYWDPISSKVIPISNSAKIEVSIDENENVTLSLNDRGYTSEITTTLA